MHLANTSDQLNHDDVWLVNRFHNYSTNLYIRLLVEREQGTFKKVGLKNVKQLVAQLALQLGVTEERLYVSLHVSHRMRGPTPAASLEESLENSFVDRV